MIENNNYSNGKKEFFKKIYEQFYSKIFSYVYLKINSIEEVEDITEEVFLKCYKNIESFDSRKAKLSTWLFVITNNTLKNYYRDKKNIVYFDNCEMLDVSETVDFDEAIYMEEMHEYIDRELLKLTDLQRELIVLKYYDELNSEEIAKRLGMSSGNVRVQISRALKQLRKSTDSSIIRMEF